MITTKSEFEKETALETTVLVLAIPMMPLTASDRGPGFSKLRPFFSYPYSSKCVERRFAVVQ
jgi:hypothetical protein